MMQFLRTVVGYRFLKHKKKAREGNTFLKEIIVDYTECGRNNSHILRGHCSGCGGGIVMGGVSLVSCGLAIFR